MLPQSFHQIFVYNVLIRLRRSFRVAVNNPYSILPRSTLPAFLLTCLFIKSFPNPSADFWKSTTHTKTYFCIQKRKNCMRLSEKAQRFMLMISWDRLYGRVHFDLWCLRRPMEKKMGLVLGLGGFKASEASPAAYLRRSKPRLLYRHPTTIQTS